MIGRWGNCIMGIMAAMLVKGWITVLQDGKRNPAKWKAFAEETEIRLVEIERKLDRLMQVLI